MSGHERLVRCMLQKSPEKRTWCPQALRPSPTPPRGWEQHLWGVWSPPQLPLGWEDKKKGCWGMGRGEGFVK